MANESASESTAGYFPTQGRKTSVIDTKTITPFDRQCGAPFGPIPKSYLSDDTRLNVCQRLPTQEETTYALKIREPFLIQGKKNPFILDVVRAFRLLKDKRNYLEIGIFDRGNLAYTSSVLSAQANLIGVDTQDELRLDELLTSKLKPGQVYTPVIGNSRSSDVVSRVREILGEQKLDAIFIDGDHTAYGVLSDYALYEDLVADDGVILFHDSVWEGGGSYKGVADALCEIDKLDPVYLIDASNPCRRFMRPMWRDRLWGVVGVVFASDQRWRQKIVANSP